MCGIGRESDPNAGVSMHRVCWCFCVMICGDNRKILEILTLLWVHFILYVFYLGAARFRLHYVFMWKLRLWISPCGCIFLHDVDINCGDRSPKSDHMCF